MYRPALQRTEVLVVMAIVTAIVFYGTSALRVERKAPGYEVKIRAVKRMARALEVLKNYHLQQAVMVDPVNDPNETGLIGHQYSLITTDQGDLDAKISVLDPNMAAMVVDLLLRTGVKAGDTIVVTLTGSMPGANLAVYCAAYEMDLVPIIVTSLGASQWGANDENFTWLDMERVLRDSGVVDYHSRAATLGGGGDIGRRLSPKGRRLLRQAAKRNQVPLLEAKSLNEIIRKRLALLESFTPLKNYRAYVNVGGGAAALGGAQPARLLKPGLLTVRDLQELPGRGLIHRLGSRGIPVIHLLNIKRLFKQFNYPYAAVPSPPPGVGPLFAEERYNLTAVSLGLAFILTMVVGVALYSRYHIRLSYRPEEIDGYL